MWDIQEVLEPPQPNDMANCPSLCFLAKVVLFIRHVPGLAVHGKCYVFVLPGAVSILERITTFLLVLTNNFHPKLNNLFVKKSFLT